jgi:Nucleotidyl transferase AbiEii toxin, Type IV TA system
MPSPRTYSTAGAFRRALEERLKQTSMSERMDLNRLRRQVSFDRLLARLFREGSPPWVLKGGYALELRFKAARSTVDIDLTVQRVPASAGDDQNQIVRELLQAAADVPLGDWFEFTFGPPVMDLTAAPYGGARYSVEARMNERIFARFHLDAGIGDVVSPPLENHRLQKLAGIRWHPAVASSNDRSRAAVRRKASRVHAAAQLGKQ